MRRRAQLGGMMAAVLLALPGAAQAHGTERVQPTRLIETDFVLDEADRAADADRWLLPDLADSYERSEPPRLRWRGRKIKLRVPIG